MKKTNEHRQIEAYTIDDISLWQTELQENKNLNSSNSKITLPSLQRGFVWKPHQIEALWDSILRGYPIGAVLMSLANGERELLDGQQRSTSIALGYYNPFDTKDFKEFLNLKENIPSVWIDLKPITQNRYGLKFGVRVLTRSHPWGYQLSDHRQTLSMSDREKALEYFRRDTGKKYTDLKSEEINPWDAHFPVPLAFLLDFQNHNFETWKTKLFDKINSNLKQIKTKYSNESFVDYERIEADWLPTLYNSIKRAKSLLIPEILVEKDTIEETENFTDENEETFEATLFIRLNSEGTRISGEELVYSLLKANFPELKVLVERIGMKYIAPSRIVNLFSRLTVMENNRYDFFQQEINIATFRKNLLNEDFKTGLKNLIIKDSFSEAEKLVQDAVSIISRHDIPEILSKELIAKSPDLFLVLLIFLKNNQDKDLYENEFLFEGYHYLTLFNSDQKKTAQQLFSIIKRNGFKKWKDSILELTKTNPRLLLPLISSSEFETTILKYIVPKYLFSQRHFSDFDFIKEILSEQKDEFNFLFKTSSSQAIDEEDARIENLHTAVELWKGISERIYWNRTFLIFAQRNYFINQFGTFMEFDGIEDTNRPWDWDHIYPNSWVSSKPGVSILVRRMVNSNGNFRALSYNENRSQSNHQSPSIRFLGKDEVMKNSFILENDMPFWLNLTNSDTRLLENNSEKINAFVYACFHRMINIYSDWYNSIGKFF
jgi:hypothetical protein